MNHGRNDQTQTDKQQEGSRNMLDQTLVVDNNPVPPVVAPPPSVDTSYNDADQHHMNFQPPQQQMQMQMQMQPPMLQPFWPPPPLPPQHSTSSSGGVLIDGNCNPALLQFYEAQMRDHAAAYASAAAAAAMTAAQIAADLASTVLAAGDPNHHHHHHQYPMIPPPLVYPQHLMQNSVSPYGSSGTTPTTQSRPLQQSDENNNNNFDIDDANDDRICHPDEDENRSSNSHHHNHHHRRRKQQRRMPPSNYNYNNNHANNNNNSTCNHTDAAAENLSQQQQGQQKRGRRRRRLWNSAGSSDSGNNNNNNDDNNYNRNRRRNRKIAMTASSSNSDGGSASCITKKKQRQPNDESLLGKTGVSALFEWCSKRRANIKMEEGKRRRLEFDDNLFEMTVSIDGVEMGIGVGITKASAKHEASRRTLQVLLPGVQFDEDSGILIRLPGTVTTTKGQPERRHTSKGSSLIGTVTSLEELAPNLAKQLAIGHNNDDDDRKKSDIKKERNISGLSEVRDSRKRQKWPHVYPGTTSTTSDDEDENSYYASRGASVCSSLLHAMVQIDERLAEPPEYTYQVSTITNEREGEGEHSKLKRKAGIPITINDTSTVFPRGSFECTGILKLRIDNTETDETDVDSFDGSSTQPRECYQVLRSFGVGGTKREARHTAAAKLLAMLFPDCVGMADVKQAAEAAREKYAASRALKQQQSKRGGGGMFSTTNNRSPTNNPDDNDVAPNFLFESLSKSNTTEIPDSIKIGILSSLGYLSNNVLSGCDNKINTNNIVASKEAGLVRQLSRQQQLEERIDIALQKLNEHDEEGRSLPEELTVDDVGRTVLRRARGDDEYWVEKLFGIKKASHADDFADLSLSSVTISASDKEPSSTIVLLLCRAFHEDPPLGCAVLTLGFSMQKGKILRIAQIASYSHQPKERFIETLSEFAKYMGCYLISTPPKSSYTTLRKDCIQQILNPPHLESLEQPLPLKEEDEEEQVHLRYKINRDDNVELSSPLDETFVNKTSLQSVQEEVEGVEESDSSTPNNDKQEKRREKPSKRSRFE
jgi:hypothetical protein